MKIKTAGTRGRAAEKLKCVNLGCGSNLQTSTSEREWINIDNYYLPDNKDFLQGDACDIPLESNSVDYLLCDQMLEHIKMSDVPVVLYNIKRVLKKGGKAIIMVPDFEDAVQGWLGFNHNGAFNPMMYTWLSEPIYGNQNHEGEYHKTPMCAGYLHYVLNMVGLNDHNISFWPRNGAIPKFPGMNSYAQGATLRNAQLLVEVVK